MCFLFLKLGVSSLQLICVNCVYVTFVSVNCCIQGLLNFRYKLSDSVRSERCVCVCVFLSVCITKLMILCKFEAMNESKEHSSVCQLV